MIPPASVALDDIALDFDEECVAPAPRRTHGNDAENMARLKLSMQSLKHTKPSAGAAPWSTAPVAAVSTPLQQRPPQQVVALQQVTPSRIPKPSPASTSRASRTRDLTGAPPSRLPGQYPHMASTDVLLLTMTAGPAPRRVGGKRVAAPEMQSDDIFQRRLEEALLSEQLAFSASKKPATAPRRSTGWSPVKVTRPPIVCAPLIHPDALSQKPVLPAGEECFAVSKKTLNSGTGAN